MTTIKMKNLSLTFEGVCPDEIMPLLKEQMKSVLKYVQMFKDFEQIREGGSV